MKKTILLFNLFIIYNISISSNWIGINSNNQSPVKINLISSSQNQSLISINLAGFTMDEVTTTQGIQYKISCEGTTPMLIANAPDLSKVTTSIIITDKDEMQVEVVSSNYKEYNNILIAPSKGTLNRTVNPTDISLIYGEKYLINDFFPGKLAELRNPYILRDYRGQTIIVYPFQYNPVTKVLRVYSDITVKIFSKGNKGKNQLNRTKQLTAVDREFDKVYSSQFLNYNSTKSSPLIIDKGNLLVICYNQYLGAMQPYIHWKITEGIPTEIVDFASIGTTSTDLKNYVVNYYNTKGLKFLLLVGDAEQIPTNNSTTSPSDNEYGYIVGNDSYPEVIVGRFSAESVNDVQTQVARTLDYEKTPLIMNVPYNRGLGIASALGPGDNNEYDYQHIRNIRTKLLNYLYKNVDEVYDGSQGGLDSTGNATPLLVSESITKGVGVINYCGHGASNAWITSGFSTSNIPTLTNTNMLPFIWSVACVNGAFVGETCFAEQWLRSVDNNGKPIGAVATMMSTINQYWDEPMCGQDGMNNILVESDTLNTQRTFGGISMNGCIKMNDTYGQTGFDMTDTWTCFGDPSLMVRTDLPKVIIASHPNSINYFDTLINVNCNAEKALVAITYNDTILGTGIINGGAATIKIKPINKTAIINICATAYNYIPYLGSIATVVQEKQIDKFNFVCYPNPYSDITKIQYYLPLFADVSIDIYNSIGQKLINIIDNKPQQKGLYSYDINTFNFGKGLYFCKLTVNGISSIKKVVSQ